MGILEVVLFILFGVVGLIVGYNLRVLHDEIKFVKDELKVIKDKEEVIKK